MDKIWFEIIEKEKKKEYYRVLKGSIETIKEKEEIYPPEDKIFNAFKLTKFKEMKVVIIGQDPYHNKGQAQGLTFSTPEDIKNPPSMQNIIKEIQSDIGYVEEKTLTGDLTHWAEQKGFYY